MPVLSTRPVSVGTEPSLASCAASASVLGARVPPAIPTSDSSVPKSNRNFAMRIRRSFMSSWNSAADAGAGSGVGNGPGGYSNGRGCPWTSCLARSIISDG